MGAMLTIGINVDSGAGIAGDAPKPVSLELDDPIAQEASGKTIETARRSNRRMFVPDGERSSTEPWKCSKKSACEKCLPMRDLSDSLVRYQSPLPRICADGVAALIEQDGHVGRWNPPVCAIRFP
jgi:hypothetical protein